MLLPILFAALLLPAQQASMHCVDTGAETAAAQTQPLPGPGGASAVLKVSTADDHSKNSHDCNAEYQLLLMRTGADTPVVVDLIMSDADYDRLLFLPLDGFSLDGKRVFGIVSETGRYPSTTLLDYDTVRGQVQLIDLKKPFAHIVAAKCSATFDAIGTTETGGIVLELDYADKCAPKSRWLLNPSSQKPQPLPQGASVTNLYH